MHIRIISSLDFEHYTAPINHVHWNFICCRNVFSDAGTSEPDDIALRVAWACSHLFFCHWIYSIADVLARLHDCPGLGC